MNLAGDMYGTVQAQEVLLRTTVTVALLGNVTASSLPAVVFVFDRDQEAAAVERWMEARALRSSFNVTQLSIVDAQQTAEVCFVCVAWNPDITDQPGAFPTQLTNLLAWLETTNRDDLGVRVTDVLKALEQLEPRAVPRTVMLETSGAVLPCHDAPHPRSTSLLAAPPAIRATAILPANASVKASSRPNAHRRRTTTLTDGAVELAADAQHTDTERPTRRWVAIGLCAGAVAAAFIAFVLPRLNGKAPPMAAVALEPVKTANPTAPPPEQVAPPPPERVTPPPIAPHDVAPPNAGEEEITIATRPSRATVCDPKTGEILGETPLNLAASKFAAGHKLLLTRAGYSFRSFRWPTDHKMTLIRLGPDELQPFSPCR